MKNLEATPGRKAKPTSGAAASRGRYRVGRATRTAIVAAAAEALVAHGYAELTLKRVAAIAGVSVGNLNYHFRTKESLIEALIEKSLSDYSTRFAELLGSGGMTGRETLPALLRWVMHDSASREYTLLFRELWAMASHNPSIASAMNHFYDQSIAAAIERMPQKFGSRQRSQVRALMTLVCLLSEGASVVFGLRGDRRAEFEAVKRIASDVIGHAAERLGEAGR